MQTTTAAVVALIRKWLADYPDAPRDVREYMADAIPRLLRIEKK